MMGDGQISEHGNYQWLIQLAGRYTRLHLGLRMGYTDSDRGYGLFPNVEVC